MESVVKWIVENPYLTAVGLFATILGLIIAIITPLIQKRRKRLFFSYSTTPLIKEDITDINGLEILFHGTPVKQLSVSTVRIWNGGNTIITPDDFYKDHDLRLISHDNISILGIDMIEQSEDTIECKIECASAFAGVFFQAFENKEYVIFNVYHTGNIEVKLGLSGKMREGKIVNKTVEIEKQISRVMEAGGFAGGIIIGTVIWAFLTALFSILTFGMFGDDKK